MLGRRDNHYTTEPRIQWPTQVHIAPPAPPPPQVTHIRCDPATRVSLQRTPAAAALAAASASAGHGHGPSRGVPQTDRSVGPTNQREPPRPVAGIRYVYTQRCYRSSHNCSRRNAFSEVVSEGATVDHSLPSGASGELSSTTT